jgi:hypothetical protein
MIASSRSVSAVPDGTTLSDQPSFEAAEIDAVTP